MNLRIILSWALIVLLFITTNVHSQQNTIIDGYARFQILSPSLIRLEYASDSNFQDTLTFNVMSRNFGVPQFTTLTENGYRIIETDQLKLSYQQTSGAFSSKNLSIIIKDMGDTIAPIGNEYLPSMLNTICEAENAILSGGAGINNNHSGFSGNGFADGFTNVGAQALWTIFEIPTEKEYTLTVNYANAAGGDGQHIDRTLSVIVNGTDVGQINLPKTNAWNDWNLANMPINLKAGQNSIALKYDNDDPGNVNLDYMVVTNPGDELPEPNSPTATANNNLGGYRQSLDGVNGPTELNDGLISTDGWYYIDDKATELWTADGWLKPRTNKGIYLDGYFFGYGHNYKQGLKDLADLTGETPLLPKWTFGNWFSRYCPYTDEEYKNIVNEFRARNIPLDVLVVDTDWKSPNSWNGWGWNDNFFPNPQEFMDWTGDEGLKVTFNIHANINNTDANFENAQSIANNSLIATGGTSGFSWITSDGGRLAMDPNATMYTWDWTRKDHSESYFSLHDPLEKQGVDFWWLDDWSDVNWINHQYAQRMRKQGKRPVYFSRIKGDNPWAEHRSTIHFTGDSEPTWSLLNFIPYFTVREGLIGMPYISHDIGTHHGGHMEDDMYIRWIQIGTFLPINRLHSSHCGGHRLPWEYSGKIETIATKYLQLRHAIVPYLYTVAKQAVQTGLPMVRGMFLDYPKSNEAYNFDRQYMLGDQILVAPITQKGSSVSKQVWLPTAGWINFFTGETYTNEGVANAVATLAAMPVFVKQGGIIPMQTYHKNNNNWQNDSLIFKVFPGNNGSFNLYEDEGSGQGYLDSLFATTTLQYTEAASDKTFTINASAGNYPNKPEERSYLVEFINVNEPDFVKLNNENISKTESDNGLGWWYNADKLSLFVRINNINTLLNTIISHNGETITIAPNQVPIANAGNDIEVIDTDNSGREEVTLDGSESYDPDGNIVAYAWKMSGSTFSDEVSPTVNLPVGITKLTLEITDNKDAIAADDVKVKINEATSVMRTDKNIKLYPSPANNMVTIESNFGSIEKIQVYNTNGVLVTEVFDSTKVNMSAFDSGLYIFKIVIDGKEFKREIIKE